MKDLQGSSLPAGTMLVLDAAQAAVVTDRLELRRLVPFMGRECTVGEAARQLGLELTPTYKLVQRFLRLGLLSQTRQQQHNGRAIRYYRAPAAFFVPFIVRPLEQIGERNRAVQLQQFERNLSHAMRRSLGQRWGGLTSVMPSGESYYELMSADGESFDPLAPAAPRILSGWNRFSLTAAEALEVQQKLMALLLPYLERETSGDLQRDTYQIGIFMAPDAAN